jgi:DNA-directed RNA polymerase specialized sigma24 family protein
MDDRDPDAFRALYRRHYGSVCRFIAARAPADHVEDVAAETLRARRWPTTAAAVWPARP